jgi:ABC-type transport system substrate-binding protein
MASEFVSNAQLRYVLQLAVDREYAADTLMGNGAVASCLPVSPLSPLYDESVAKELKFDLELCARLLDSLDVKDTNGDGKREYVEYSQLKEIGIDLIVCSESELSWTDYQNALMNGDFDMYYAEVKLGADFDLTSLLTKDAALNYGKIDDENYATYINDFLAATDLERPQACCNMLYYIATTTPIIPILFERQEVITHRNVITSMDPTSSNVFFGIENWTITFSSETDNGEEQ